LETTNEGGDPSAGRAGLSIGGHMMDELYQKGASAAAGPGLVQHPDPEAQQQ
jgi:hypothetical protein